MTSRYPPIYAPCSHFTMSECWVYACRRHAWRRGLCKFHHHQRALLQDHCTKWQCVKPCFRDTLCRHHFRVEYGRCCIPTCTGRFYMAQLCRKHYKTHRSHAPKHCAKCESRVFLFGLCFKHYTSKSCSICGDTARAKGLCTKHYFRSIRSMMDAETHSAAPSMT